MEDGRARDFSHSMTNVMSDAHEARRRQLVHTFSTPASEGVCKELYEMDADPAGVGPELFELRVWQKMCELDNNRPFPFEDEIARARTVSPAAGPVSATTAVATPAPAPAASPVAVPAAVTTVSPVLPPVSATTTGPVAERRRTPDPPTNDGGDDEDELVFLYDQLPLPTYDNVDRYFELDREVDRLLKQPAYAASAEYAVLLAELRSIHDRDAQETARRQQMRAQEADEARRSAEERAERSLLGYRPPEYRTSAPNRLQHWWLLAGDTPPPGGLGAFEIALESKAWAFDRCYGPKGTILTKTLEHSVHRRCTVWFEPGPEGPFTKLVVGLKHPAPSINFAGATAMAETWLNIRAWRYSGSQKQMHNGTSAARRANKDTGIVIRLMEVLSNPTGT